MSKEVYNEWQDFDESYLKEVDAILCKDLESMGIEVPDGLSREELYSLHDREFSKNKSGMYEAPSRVEAGE